MNASTFDIQNQHEFVQRHGDTVSWKRCFKCPCAPGADANRSNPSCVVCRGTGFRYAEAVSLIGLVTGIHHEKSLLDVGIAKPGDMMFGVSPLETAQIQDYDVIETTWGSGMSYEGDLIVRGTGATDQLVYAAASILGCFTVDPLVGTITDYLEGTSFTVADKAITWLSDQPQPLADQVYSVKYQVKSWEWVCFVSPMARYERATDLGPRMLLRMRHLVNAA